MRHESKSMSCMRTNILWWPWAILLLSVQFHRFHNKKEILWWEIPKMINPLIPKSAYQVFKKSNAKACVNHIAKNNVISPLIERKILCTIVWNKGWITMKVKCKHCGKDFELFTSDFCSMDCTLNYYLKPWLKVSIFGLVLYTNLAFVCYIVRVIHDFQINYICSLIKRKEDYRWTWQEHQKTAYRLWQAVKKCKDKRKTSTSVPKTQTWSPGPIEKASQSWRDDNQETGNSLRPRKLISNIQIRFFIFL